MFIFFSEGEALFPYGNIPYISINIHISPTPYGGGCAASQHKKNGNHTYSNTSHELCMGCPLHQHRASSTGCMSDFNTPHRLLSFSERYYPASTFNSNVSDTQPLFCLVPCMGYAVKIPFSSPLPTLPKQLPVDG
ncbi:hypothetical protein D3C74_166300 [compost metagenome]